LSALACLCFGLAAACFGLAAARGGSGDDEVPLPPITPFTEDESQRLHEIRDAVAELRELPVAEGVKEGTLDRDALREYYKKLFEASDDKDKKDIAVSNAALRLMHVLTKDQSIDEEVSDAYGTAVAGFYEPDEDELVLVAGEADEIDLEAELTLSHEYAHSLQDASLGLDALQDMEDDETEYGTTISCVYEGDAEFTSIMYMFQQHGLGWIDELTGDENPDEPISASDEDIPDYIARSMGFDYNECAMFVAQVFNERGWDGINELYKHPPTTTEQVLHPQKYFKQETARLPEPVDFVHALGKGWHKSGDSAGVFGEFDVYNYLASAGLDESQALEAAGGWGGGRMSLYSRDAEQGEDVPVLLHISLNWDSSRELQEFEYGYADLLRALAFDIETPDAVTATWSKDGEYGYWYQDAEANHVDILLSTDQDAIDAALGELKLKLAEAR
jgi:hypothetical protein